MFYIVNFVLITLLIASIGYLIEHILVEHKTFEKIEKDKYITEFKKEGRKIII